MQNTLENKIALGTATSEELEEHFGSKLIMAGLAAVKPENEVRREAKVWHNYVTRPMGIPLKLSYQLFTGYISNEDFLDQLTPNQFNEFVTTFQTRNQKYLDDIS